MHAARRTQPKEGEELHRKGRTPNGIRFALVANNETEDRLQSTCFRKRVDGQLMQRAGNFRRYRGTRELLNDPVVMQELCAVIGEMFENDPGQTESVTIEHDKVVGWESTIPMKDAGRETLETFEPNGRAYALRIVRADFPAPPTKLITFVLSPVWRERYGNWRIIVRSIYPGEDIGELSGNITKREGRVFLDWMNPGEELA